MYLPAFLNLGARFSTYFRVLPALDDQVRVAAYRIRHAVYCEELGYEAIRSDGLECDEFDRRSTQCVLQNVSDGEYVGCVRLVLSDPDQPDARLPFENVCGDSLDATRIDVAKLDRARVAEVSRLAVVARYRRRRGERSVPLGIDESDFGTPERPRFPYIAAGLYLAMIAQARHHGIETLFMLTERRLAKQLSRLGVNIQSIGEAVEHRGLRYPSMMSVQEIIANLGFFVRPLFDVIAHEVEAAYRASPRHEATARLLLRERGGVTPASSGNPS